MSRKKTQTFVEGALILMVANIIVKVVGALYKIPLTNLIGASGMGYMNDAYDFYTFLLVISTAGLPTAVSKMVSSNYALGRYKDVKSIFRVTFITFGLIGLVGMIIMLVGSKAFAHGINNDNAYYSVMAIAPAVLCCTVSSTYRGYFQGLGNMFHTAVSQVIEALCKLVIGLVLADYIMNLGKPVYMASAGAITGVTMGTVLSVVYLTVAYSILKKRGAITADDIKRAPEAKPGSTLFKELISIAIPITIGSSVLSITNLIDLFIVKNRLVEAVGFTQEHANMLSGAYSMSRTMFNLPASMIVPLGVSVIPAIAAAFALNEGKKVKTNISTALSICTLFALPCGVGLSVLAKPILNLLYYSRPDDVEIAAPLLVPLGVAVIFVCMVSVTNSILQAIGKEMLPVISMAIGGIVKLTMNFTLIGIPDINIYGAPVGTICCYGVITVLNIIFIAKHTSSVPNFWQLFFKPLVASAVMGVSAFGSHAILKNIMGGKLATVIAILIAVIVYLIVLVLIRGLREDVVSQLPKGGKLVAILKKRNLLGK